MSVIREQVKKGTWWKWDSSIIQNGAPRLQTSVREDEFLERHGDSSPDRIEGFSSLLPEINLARDVLESHLYFEDMAYVQGFPFGILFFLRIRSSSSLPSRDKLRRERNKSHLYFRDTSQGGFGFPAPLLSGTSWAGDMITPLLFQEHLLADKGIQIIPLPGIIWAGDIRKGPPSLPCRDKSNSGRNENNFFFRDSSPGRNGASNSLPSSPLLSRKIGLRKVEHYKIQK